MRMLLRGLGGLLFLVLAGAGALIAADWAPDRTVEELKARWAPPPSQFIDVAGMGVHLRDEGPREDPVPLVLLHGTSASLHTWDGWAERLRESRRVIRFDLPGFGLTGPTPDGNYGVENYVRVVVAVLDRLGVPRCTLVGNSFGGYVAWATALLQPQRVDRLVLVDAGGYPYQSESVPIGFRLARINGLEWLVERVTPRRLVEASVKNVYGDPSRVTPELVDRYYELTLRAGNRAALVARFRQAGPGDLSARVPELKLPTLILWGGKDRLIPPQFGKRFNSEIIGSQRFEFPELGHVPQEEDPEQTVNAAQAFLAKNVGSE